MYVFIKQLLTKLGSSITLIIGNLLYNFYILYFSSSFKNTDFLYFITVLTTITSLLYTIENIFQYYYGRLLYIDNENTNVLINKVDAKYSIDDIQTTINFFYFIFISFILIIFIPLFFIFSEFYVIVIIYFITCSFNVASGFYSLILISNNEIKKLHLSTGIIKITFFISSILLYKYIYFSKIPFFLLLLFFSFLHFIVQKKLSSITNSILRFKINYFVFKNNFLKISDTALRQSIISIIGFFILKIYILIGNKYIPKDILNSSSLIQSLFTVSLMFGGMYTVLNMNEFASGNNRIKLLIYKKSILFSLFFYFSSLFIIYFFNYFIITHFNYQVLPINFFIIIAIIYFFETLLGISATLYLYMQKIIYFKSSLYTALLLFITYTFIYFNKTNVDPIIMLTLPLAYQLMYNYWYYPSKLYIDLNNSKF